MRTRSFGEPSGAHCRSLGFPGFPVELGGVGGLHAPFLTERRTRDRVRRSVAGNPGSLGMTKERVALPLGSLIRMEDPSDGSSTTHSAILSMEALPSPLSSRAKPRDLQCAPDGFPKLRDLTHALPTLPPHLCGRCPGCNPGPRCPALEEDSYGRASSPSRVPGSTWTFGISSLQKHGRRPLPSSRAGYHVYRRRALAQSLPVAFACC